MNMLLIVECGISWAGAERRLRMRGAVRQIRALSASCVEIGGAPGSVASAFNFARLAEEMRSRTEVSAAVASKGWGGACSAFAGGAHLYAGWSSILNDRSL